MTDLRTDVPAIIPRRRLASPATAYRGRGYGEQVPAVRRVGPLGRARRRWRGLTAWRRQRARERLRVGCRSARSPSPSQRSSASCCSSSRRSSRSPSTRSDVGAFRRLAAVHHRRLRDGARLRSQPDARTQLVLDGPLRRNGDRRALPADRVLAPLCGRALAAAGAVPDHGTLFASYLVRIYAWRTILGDAAVPLNTGLERLGLIDQPLEFLLYSRFAVTVALVHIFLPLRRAGAVRGLRAARDRSARGRPGPRRRRRCSAGARDPAARSPRRPHPPSCSSSSCPPRTT